MTIEFFEKKGWIYLVEVDGWKYFEYESDRNISLYFYEPYLKIYFYDPINMELNKWFDGRCLSEYIYHAIHETIIGK